MIQEIPVITDDSNIIQQYEDSTTTRFKNYMIFPYTQQCTQEAWLGAAIVMADIHNLKTELTFLNTEFFLNFPYL